MSDCKFPFQILNGDLAIVTDDQSVFASQIKSYFSIYQGESELDPNFGRTTNPQISDRNKALYGELERLNALRYFDTVNLTADIVNRELILRIYNG